MVRYQVKLTKQAQKDREKLLKSNLSKKAKALIDLIRENPLQTPPSYEKLVGDLKGYYSRRINIQHRMVYRIMENEKLVIIHSLWSHYES